METLGEDWMPKLYDNEVIKRHIQDALILFKSISKKIKTEDDKKGSTYTLKS